MVCFPVRLQLPSGKQLPWFLIKWFRLNPFLCLNMVLAVKQQGLAQLLEIWVRISIIQSMSVLINSVWLTLLSFFFFLHCFYCADISFCFCGILVIFINSEECNHYMLICAFPDKMKDIGFPYRTHALFSWNLWYLVLQWFDILTEILKQALGEGCYLWSIDNERYPEWHWRTWSAVAWGLDSLSCRWICMC